MKIVAHEFYTEFNPLIKYDIGLIRIDPITPSATIYPACISVSDLSIYYGKTATIIGFGDPVGDGAAASDVLKKATTTILSLDECKETYSDLDESQLCAQSETNSTCQGDSGGPIMVEVRLKFSFFISIYSIISYFQNGQDEDGNPIYEILGATSYGLSGCIGAPGVFSSIPYYKEWILNEVHDASCI